jgi:hypothetical protein
MLVSILLVLVISPVFSSINLSWAFNPNAEKLSMSTIEDVNILLNGDALLALTINMPNSSLAGFYREMLAAPSDARVGEEMTIPEMAQAEFYKSVKQEQKFSFGFTTQILGSSMMPKGENNEFEVSVDAIATLQVINVTASGSDGIWEIKVGPRSDDVAEIVAGYLFSKIMLAQMLLKSLEGEQAYEASWIMKISLPEEATLLNRAELSGLSWTLDFGGGTFISTCVSVVESTIVFDEKTFVREQNFTRDPTEIYEVFRDHKAFVIRYLLPDSALVGLERFESGVFERDFYWEEDADLFPFKESTTLDVPGLNVSFSANASLVIYAGIAWDFDWDWWPPHWYLDWFKAWIGAETSVGMSLDVNCTAEDGMSYVWKNEPLYNHRLYRFETWVGIPIWADLNLRVLADLDVGASTALEYHYSVEFGAGFEAVASWDGGWDQWLDWDKWEELEPPSISVTQASAWANAALKFRLEFMLFGVGGPYLELEPYVDGRHTYVDEEFTLWAVTLGLRVNIGVTFAGWLSDMVESLHDYSYELWNGMIEQWEGWIGKAPTYISVSLNPDSTYIGGGTTIMGTVSSDYGEQYYSLAGKVKIQVSYDGVNYFPIGTTTSLEYGGSYSYWWVPSSDGTLYIRSKWLGNSMFRGATSDSIVLSVSSIPMGVQELSQDDGSNGGVVTLQYPVGRAVRFTAPTSNSMLLKIKVLGGYVGVDDLFYIEVWDSNFNELFSDTWMIHSKFEPYDPLTPLTWATINIPNIAISGDFYIVISAYERMDPESKLVIGSDYTSPGLWPYHSFPDSFRVNIEDNSIIEPAPPDGHRYCYFIRAVVDIALLDRTMCKDIDDEYPVERTNDFCINDEYAYSWVKFARDMGFHRLRWELRSPDDDFIHSESIETSPDWDGIAWVQIPIASIEELLEPYLGRTFKIKIFLDGDLYFTEKCRVWRDYSISITLSQSSIVLGESLEISSQTSPVFPMGTTKIQYWLGTWPYIPGWNDIAVGAPEAGYYSCHWVPPHAGTYFIRAIWGGYLDYSTMESPPQALIVNPASTELSTSLNLTVASAGSNITITATMTPTLAGKNIHFQYSPDDLTWYYISAGTTDSIGQCFYNWTVLGLADHYYVRTMWYGEHDYSGTASLSQYVEVLPQEAPTNIVAIKNVTVSKTEIAQGDPLSIDVEVENLGDDTATFDLYTLANNTLVETKPTSLEKGISSTIAFEWDTAGFDLGNCTIRVYASPVLGEGNVDDNIYIGGPVKILASGISATIEFSPNTMNLKGVGRIAAYIELQEGYDVNNINVSSILLNRTIPVDLSESPTIGDYDNDTIPDIALYFNRTTLSEYIVSQGITSGNVTLAITGELNDGTPFEGNNTVKVSDMSGDVNGDGIINILDLVRAAGAFGARPGYSNWDPLADIYPDNHVDIYDLVMIAQRFGQHC